MKFTQEEIGNMNSSKSIKHILKFTIFPKRKIQVQMALLMNSANHLRKKENQSYTKSSLKWR